jgi:cytidylate kinase
MRPIPYPARVSKPLVVAIDGPAGSGKSTLARALASRLGWAYLDTGAMYRAVAVRALDDRIEARDAEAVVRMAQEVALDLGPDGRIRLDGHDVTSRIRTSRVDAAVSEIAAIPGVRAIMVSHQRRYAEEHGRIVAEGRDIGTVVFPDAVLKLYLHAQPEERARRRAAERSAGGEGGPAEDVRTAIDRRDRLDQERTVAPLRRADDAVLLDTTGLDPGQVLDRAYAAVQSRIASPAGG